MNEKNCNGKIPNESGYFFIKNIKSNETKLVYIYNYKLVEKYWYYYFIYIFNNNISESSI